MAEKLRWEYLPRIQRLRHEFRYITDKIHQPLLIVMKGHGCTGRRMLAFSLAMAIGCPLIKEDDVGLSSSGSANQVLYRIAESNLVFGISLVIDSQLSDYSLFLQLQSLARSTETKLFIVECIPYDETELWLSLENEEIEYGRYLWDKPSSLEDLRRLLNDAHLSDYDVGETPKLIVRMAPNEFVSKPVYYVLAHLHPNTDNQNLAEERKCDGHAISYCGEQTEREKPCTYRCTRSGCTFILEKSCTQLPEKLWLSYPHESGVYYLRTGEDRDKCICCKQLLKGFYYSDSNGRTKLDLDCLLLPSKRRVKFHKHRLQLELLSNFTCAACGLTSERGLWYRCQRCSYEIETYCAWLPERVVYETHGHPFKLTLDMRDNTDKELYCDFCEEKRDENRWIYYCEENCDYAAHPRCIIPLARPLLEANHE